jgi:hypothetical protein
VTIQAELVDSLAELRIVVRAVDIVAIEAGYAAAVHDALHVVVPLHAIFVRGAVGEVREGLLAELVVFELPEIGEVKAGVIADGPVVILSFDGTGERAAL